jgi:monofunctional biosynthetic peptidoglycan transglycosylase
MRSPLARALLFAIALAGGLALAVAAAWAALPPVAWLAAKNPKTTALIEQRRAEARKAGRSFHPRQAWVAFGRISPHLVEAVLVSEDARFYAHGAFDWQELRAAAAEDLEHRRFLRGGSTLTQQLAKNLFLGTEKSLTRKAKEAILAAKLDQRLSKRRQLTLYLNVAEWGDGLFGAEVAAQAHFGVAAADLGVAQSAVLAAMLPHPRRCSPSHPTRSLERRSRRILDRLLEAGRIDSEAHAHASAELERILAGAPTAAPAQEGDDSSEDSDDDEG